MLALRAKVLNATDMSRRHITVHAGLFVLLIIGCIVIFPRLAVSDPVLGILALCAGFCLSIGIYLSKDWIAKFRDQSVPSELSKDSQSLNMQVSDKPDHQLSDATVEQLFNELPVALIQIDDRDQVPRVNCAARKLLRASDGETTGFADLVEGLGRSVNTWLAMQRDGSAPSKSEMVKVKRRSADVFLQVSFLHLPDTKRGDLVGVLSDATELKSLEAQFIQSQKMQAIGQLAGGVAHDFNNLLTAISGYCDLLLLRHEKGSPDFGDLTQISQNANRAAGLVGQLLAFSRKQTLQPKDIDVQETLRDLTHLLNRLVGEKTRLSFDGDDSLPRAYVDGRQLEQVIMNLVVNARDAMTDGGEIVIDTRLQNYGQSVNIDGVPVSAGKYISIEVRDTGCGIPAEVLPKIFEPFYSTKDVGDGTGLGLSTAYGIVKQTGGFVFAESEVGVGSVFKVLLPIFEGTLATEQRSKNKVSVERGGLNGKVILLVEDEAPVRAFAARALRMQGAIVLECDSAEIALENLDNDAIAVDVVISDVIMPGMDGPTWVRKALLKQPELKVVFVSGYAEESFADEHARIAGSVFLPKPFSLIKLIETVQHAIDQ